MLYTSRNYFPLEKVVKDSTLRKINDTFRENERLSLLWIGTRYTKTRKTSETDIPKKIEEFQPVETTLSLDKKLY